MLHKIISSFVLILLLTSCQGPSNALRLKGTVDLSDGNAILHIISDLNNQPKVIDTLPVRSGSFDLEVEIIEPGVHFLQIQGDQASRGSHFHRGSAVGSRLGRLLAPEEM